MKDYEFYQTLNDLVTHARLHVAMLNVNKKNVPTTTSNVQYIKYLKPKIKCTKWKLVKQEIKTLINIGRSKGNLEQKLEELNENTLAYLRNTLDRLFDFLHQIESEYQWDSTMMHSPKHVKPNTFYFDEADIEHIKNEEVFLRELTVYVCSESFPLAKEIVATKAQYELVEIEVVPDTQPLVLKCSLVVLGI